MKTCPFCAEEIQDAAIVCKHCGRGLSVTDNKAIVEHLSREIATNTQQMMVFRTRVCFTAWIGPFLVAAAYLASAPDGANLVVFPWLFPFGAVLFIVLGYALGHIERHIWIQCNKWRTAISQLHQGDEAKLQAGAFTFIDQVRLGYLVVAVLMLAVFSCVVMAVGLGLPGT